jgi:signal transduction histidine kinase
LHCFSVPLSLCASALKNLAVSSKFNTFTGTLAYNEECLLFVCVAFDSMTTSALATVVLLLIPLCMSLYLGLLVLRRRQVRGAFSFACTILIMGWWCLSALLVVLSPDDNAAHFWMSSLFGIGAFLPVGIFFSSRQVSSEWSYTLRRLLPWLIVPTITALLSLTNTQQTLHYHDIAFIRGDGGEVIAVTHANGIWTLIHLAYSYIIVGYSVLLLIRQITTIKVPAFRIRLVLLLIGLIIPFAATIVNSLVLERHVFITPMSFIIVVPLFYWAFTRYRLFELSPIARDLAFEQMSEAVIIVDSEQRIIDANPSAALLSDQPISSLVGKSLIDGFPQFGGALDTDTTHQVIHIGETDARYYDSRMSSIASGGQPVGKLLLLRDVTEQQQAREQLRRSDIEAERVRTVSAFIEAISHEIRTPLTTIKTATYLINRIDDKDKRREKTEQIDRQVEAVSQLVDSLLALLRLRPDVVTSFKLLNINAIAEAAIKPLQPQFEAQHVALTVELASNLPPVRGNKDYVQDALHAVLHNALRYTPVGGRVTLHTGVENSQITVTVSDTGIGIAPEHLPHIFNLFYRVDKARTTSGFGTGLAIAQRVMELHGGTISAHSSEGAGSTFVMTLPML